ncbi:gfo/Idh/MocA family oxidoreductase [Alginatibacterium sediminis]|uniref:Gfo/Idh/MocA family oxidoreductase n=1 Tax=Alginatibacterium sediminis TaxID=2164068 RepID=A0A420EAV8_9ALTE|nr:Gfo/Idh/MocA family oxidoreductase [Alginatibacterium sediminis]RKF17811.1 gfo/Idh/MocA family oxidoreductase [Alginatibacterium sediminis]
MKRVAVVGLGNIAIRHRRNLKQLFPSSKLYAMSASGRLPVEIVCNCDQVVSSIDELIVEQIELVIVASPAPFHARHAIKLIEAGIPTLIEKPVTTSVCDAKRIQSAINKYRTPVAVGYCLRYLPSAQKLRKLLQQQTIGVVYNAFVEIGQYLPQWRPNKDYRDCVSARQSLGGGALYELSHELDYTQWLLGPLRFQHATLRSSQELGLEVEDIADIIAIGKNNEVATIHLDFLQQKAHRKCSFIGSEGRIDWDLIQNQLVLTTAAEVKTIYHDPEWDKNKMYLAMVTDFVKQIQGNGHNCVLVEEANATVFLIDEIKSKAVYL